MSERKLTPFENLMEKYIDDAAYSREELLSNGVGGGSLVGAVKSSLFRFVEGRPIASDLSQASVDALCQTNALGKRETRPEYQSLSEEDLIAKKEEIERGLRKYLPK